MGSIGGRDLRPASLPVLLRGHRVLFIRYAARPIIGTLNPPMSRPVIVELPAPGRVEVDGMLVVANSDGSVTSISAAQGPHQVEVGFLPGFPDLSGLPRGSSASGRWSIRVANVPVTGGSYSASREGDRVAVELDVTERWRPYGLPTSIELFTRVVPVFRTWPSTYRWRGTVELSAAVGLVTGAHLGAAAEATRCACDDPALRGRSLARRCVPPPEESSCGSAREPQGTLAPSGAVMARQSAVSNDGAMPQRR